MTLRKIGVEMEITASVAMTCLRRMEKYSTGENVKRDKLEITSIEDDMRVRVEIRGERR